MSKKIFSEKEINELSKNKYVFLKSTEFRKHREANDLKAKEIILKAFNHRGYKKGSRSIKMTLENEFFI